jgi:hypothetical protein
VGGVMLPAGRFDRRRAQQYAVANERSAQGEGQSGVACKPKRSFNALAKKHHGRCAAASPASHDRNVFNRLSLESRLQSVWARKGDK